MRFLSLPKIIIFFASIFVPKKLRKSKILSSQNTPKIHPKCLQNRCPTKPAFFCRLFAYFGCFRLCALFLRIAFRMHFDSKKPTKKHLKTRPNPLKIDVKNMSFFNIVFFGFRPRFWKVLGLQDGAKLAKNRNFPHGDLTFFTCLS